MIVQLIFLDIALLRWARQSEERLLPVLIIVRMPDLGLPFPLLRFSRVDRWLIHLASQVLDVELEQFVVKRWRLLSVLVADGWRLVAHLPLRAHLLGVLNPDVALAGLPFFLHGLRNQVRMID